MAEYPSLPLFTDAFIADTLHLNAAQTGAYLMLIMCAWRSKDCTIPDDDKQLARFARMSPKEWAKNKAEILHFWTKIDGKFYQKRLSDERKWVNTKRDQAITAGKRSALKRKERHSTDGSTERQRKVNHPTPTPTPIEKKDNKLSQKKVEKPEDISKQAWEDFIAHRKAKKAPVTETVLKTIASEADKISWSLEQAISEMCARGWQGFKAQWIINENQKGKTNETLDDVADRVLARHGIGAQKIPDRPHGQAVLRNPRHLPENQGRIGLSHGGDD